MNRYTARAAAAAAIKESEIQDWRAPIRRKLRSRPQ
jgi:hypothetical protein